MPSLLVTVLTCACFFAAADRLPFTGTWRLNLEKTEGPKKPYETELGNGFYKCFTCDPKLEVKADGQNHPVSGHPSFDMMNVKIISERVVETTSTKEGKVVSEGTETVSANGNRLVSEYSYYPPNNPEPVKSKVQFRRVGTIKPGVHAVSGAWVLDKMDSISENAREITYEQSADGMSETDPTGGSYSAKFDGKEYPVKGDNSVDTVVLKRINERTIEETYKYQGKIKLTNEITISADGKTMTMAWRDSNGFSGKSILERK